MRWRGPPKAVATVQALADAMVWRSNSEIAAQHLDTMPMLDTAKDTVLESARSVISRASLVPAVWSSPMRL
ncbi:hypothetical protein [Nocardia sp. NPDC051463]|uniref:hypothetical protein n=1 Tax=Nocardia sp. NPDC051463 TaxID=3154845 RepID=UPI00344E0A92